MNYTFSEGCFNHTRKPWVRTSNYTNGTCTHSVYRIESQKFFFCAPRPLQAEK